MQRFILVRNDVTYLYRIGKRKAEYYRYSDGKEDTHNDEITPKQAEKDIQELRRSGFGIIDDPRHFLNFLIS